MFEERKILDPELKESEDCNQEDSLRPKILVSLLVKAIL